MNCEARSSRPSTSINEIIIDQVRTLEDRQTIFEDYYQEILRNIGVAVRCKRPGLYAMQLAAPLRGPHGVFFTFDTDFHG